MERKEIIAIILFLFATVGTVLGIFTVEKIRRNKLYDLELIARAPEHGNWLPREFTVSYGTEVTILIRNIDTATHGFAIPQLNIAAREIKAGEAKTITFTPNQRGTFDFMCTVWCSDRHLEMRGKITVE